MLSTPNRAMYPNHLETCVQENHHEDDVQSVKTVISLYQANKLDKSTAWNCSLIDKLEALVRNHNAFVRNFRNIGISLDATMKVYEIRVDSVCNDVRRLGYGTTNDLKKSTNDRNIGEHVSGSEVNICARQVRQHKRQKRHQVNPNITLLNSPLNKISMPDELLFKLNSITDDFESVNRLFLTILPTKDSFLQILCRGPFLTDNGIPEPIEFQDSYDEEDDYFIVPLCLPQNLPIRPISCGLSGYEICNNPIDEDYTIDFPEEDNEPFLPEYAFDPNIDYLPIEPSQVPSHPNNAKLSDEISNDHDFNNNNDAEVRSEIDTAVENISRGEYSYKAFSNVKHYWAGPTYWKIMSNRNTARNTLKATSQAQTEDHQKRGKKTIELPKFVGIDSDSTDNELFFKITSKRTKSIRQCQYRRWLPEKLKLPSQFNIPNDLFYTYTFCPSTDIFECHKEDSEVEDNEDNDDEVSSSQMHFDDNFYDDVGPVSAQADEINNYDDGGAANISEHYENPPQMIEKIPIAFEKRAKVVNMSRLNKITLWSIDRQFEHTAKNGIVCSINLEEVYELGKAMFSNVYEDLQRNQRKFMPENNITPSLALFSILSAVNRERLRINRKPNEQNDFEIVQLKKISE